MSTPKNCHYVTRGMTTPWEVGQRQLWFYDFDRDEVRQLSSKALFAGDQLLSKDAELKFKQIIEDPLIRLRDEVLKDPEKSSFDWKVFRAASLYFMGQVQRFKITLDPQNKDNELEEFLKRDDSYLDQLAQASNQKHQIIGIRIPTDQQLFYPQAGFFVFFFIDESQVYGYSSGFAVPLTPHWALGMIPKNANGERLAEALQIISPYSIGIGENAKQVVIPPDVKNNNSDESIKEHMKEKRVRAKEMTADFLKMKELVRKMYATVGLSLEDGLAELEVP